MNLLLKHINFGILLCVTVVGHAQIDYSENFSAGATGWTGSGFETATVADCSGNGAIRARVNSQIAESKTIMAISAPLGVSDGGDVALHYSIRLLAYDAAIPQYALPNTDFGRITLDVGPSVEGPWSTVDRIDISTYTPTADCLQRTATLGVPSGQRLYLRFAAIPGTAVNQDYYVYIDEISAVQGTLADLTAGGTLASAYINPADNYLHIEYSAPVDEWGIFNMQGQQVTVRDIDGNGSRLDISGLAYGNYMIKLRSADKIETLNIFKQ